MTRADFAAWADACAAALDGVNTAKREAKAEVDRLTEALNAARSTARDAAEAALRARGPVSRSIHLRDGYCAAVLSSGDSWHHTYTNCSAKANRVCPDCGGPFCGRHDHEPKRGFSNRGHHCTEWKQEVAKMNAVARSASDSWHGGATQVGDHNGLCS